MRQLSAAAQSWIALVLLGGAAALVIAARQATQSGHAAQLFAPAFWLLLICACIAHAFPVIAPRHQAYHATQAFLLASVLVLTWPGVVLIVVGAHVAEWLRRPRPAYIQLYNISSYLTATAAAYWLLDASRVRPFGFDDPRSIAMALLAAGVMLILNHGLTAVVLWLARNVKPSASGLFGLESLGLDGLLLVVGVAIGAGLEVQPLSIVITGSPLILIYRALRVANVESTSHRDQLTGLYNARHLQEALDLELRRSRSEARSTGLMVAVFDDIPATVQQHGRASLDFLVVALAERLRPVLREFDQLARIDDASLGILLPAIDATPLHGIARQVSDQVAGQPFGIPTTREPVHVTASLAFAALPASPSDEPADLIAHLHASAMRAALSGPRAISEVQVPPGRASVGAELPPPLEHAPVASEASWTPPRQWLRSLEVLTIGAGLALTGLVLLENRLPDLALIAGILGLVALSELLAFELYDRSSFSVSFAPIVAAGLLGGLGGTLVAVWSVALVRGIVRRSAWHRIAFNASAFTVTGVPALLVATAGARLQVDVGNVAPLAVSTVFASGVYYLHTFLIALAIAMDVGADPRRVWTRNYRWLFPHYVLLGWMGLGLAVATLALGPLGTALFVAPPLAMRFVLKQYIDHTAGSVHRLEAANAELRTASQLLRQRGEELALLSDLGQLVAAEPRIETLPTLVLQRCVPALGETCAIVWKSRSGVERDQHGSAEVTDYLCARSPEEVVMLGEEVERGSLPVWAAPIGGSWAAAPLRGADQPLGWMLAWNPRQHSEEEQRRRLALMREVAQRVALVLERDALLQESAELEALRTIDRAKSDFIATTAHELRTPLTSLQGYTELLRGPVDAALRDRWLDIVHVEAAQLGHVVDQLLDVSRLDSGRFQAERREFGLREVIQRVLEDFGAQAALSGNTLVLDTPQPPTVFADPAQIERVLRNLVSNAIKYSPGGGAVRIVAAETALHEVEICVQDNGLGIPLEWLDRLFERFQRVERPERDSIRGTGLGLYIARQLVELNAGRIWVTSQGVGQGSAFHFTLPRAPTR